MNCNKNKMKSEIYDDYCIFLGKNQNENEYLLECTKNGRGMCRDYVGVVYWFHVDCKPSPHVILHARFKPTGKMIKEAAVFLKENSKYKSEKKVVIKCVNRKYVHQTNIPGSVTLSHDGFVIRI